MKSGKTTGIRLNLEENLRNYYKKRGWDWETGKRTEEKEAISLKDVEQIGEEKRIDAVKRLFTDILQEREDKFRNKKEAEKDLYMNILRY